MKIILGSSSEDKRKILENAFGELHLEVDVGGVEVESQITGQPLDKKTALRGARNRVKNAKRAMPDADFWVGLEGGLHDYGEGYHLVTYACLVGQGDGEFVGEGTEIHLPEAVSEEVKKGGWFGNAIRIYAKDHKIDKNLITRETPFVEAIQNAYASYLIAKGGLVYRQKSSAIVINQNNQFLILQLQSYGEDQWNVPGGGIEKGETPEEAIIRELKEELGTDGFKIVEKSKHKNKYDFPVFVVARELKKGNKYKGQIQTQFIVRYLGENDEIKVQKGEIRKYKWVDYESLQEHLVFPNQWESVKKVIEESSI